MNEMPIINILKISKYFITRGLLVGLVASFFLITFNKQLIPESYEASATVKVNGLSWKESTSSSINFSRAELLSQDNIRKTLMFLGMYNTEEINTRFSKIMSYLGYNQRTFDPELAVNDIQQSVLFQVAEPAKIGNDNDIYVIKYRDRDKIFASNLVNNLIDNFNKSYVQGQQEYYKEIISNIKISLDDVNEKIKEANNKLSSSLSNIDLRSKEDISKDVADARKTILETEALIAELNVRKKNLENMLSATYKVENTSSLEEIEKKKQLLSNLHKKYTDEHPQIIALSKEIEELEKAEKNRTYSRENPNKHSLEMELSGVKASLIKSTIQLSNLKKQVSMADSSLVNSSNIKTLESTLESLQLTRATLETKLNNYLTFLNILESGNVAPLQIINKANPIFYKDKPRYILMIIALFVGFGIAVFYSCIRGFIILNEVQSFYGNVTYIPKIIDVEFKGIETDSGGNVRKIYSLPVDDQNSKQIMCIDDKISNIQHCPEDILSLTLNKLYVNSFNGKSIIFILTLGYMTLFSIIMANYLNNFYNIF